MYTEAEIVGQSAIQARIVALKTLNRFYPYADRETVCKEKANTPLISKTANVR